MFILSSILLSSPLFSSLLFSSLLFFFSFLLSLLSLFSHSQLDSLSLSVKTPEEALQILEKNRPGIQARVKEMEEHGYPAYTTSAGWLGYSDDLIRQVGLMLIVFVSFKLNTTCFPVTEFPVEGLFC